MRPSLRTLPRSPAKKPAKKAAQAQQSSSQTAPVINVSVSTPILSVEVQI